MFRAALNQLIYFPEHTLLAAPERRRRGPGLAALATPQQASTERERLLRSGRVVASAQSSKSPPRGDRQSLVDMAVAALPLKEARRISPPSVAMPMQMGVSARPRVSCAFGDERG
jgi:hypothetical protein